MDVLNLMKGLSDQIELSQNFDQEDQPLIIDMNNYCTSLLEDHLINKKTIVLFNNQSPKILAKVNGIAAQSECLVIRHFDNTKCLYLMDGKISENFCSDKKEVINQLRKRCDIPCFCCPPLEGAKMHHQKNETFNEMDLDTQINQILNVLHQSKPSAVTSACADYVFMGSVVFEITRKLYTLNINVYFTNDMHCNTVYDRGFFPTKFNVCLAPLASEVDLIKNQATDCELVESTNETVGNFVSWSLNYQQEKQSKWDYFSSEKLKKGKVKACLITPDKLIYPVSKTSWKLSTNEFDVTAINLLWEFESKRYWVTGDWMTYTNHLTLKRLVGREIIYVHR